MIRCFCLSIVLCLFVLCLFLFSDLFMRTLRIGSLNINGGRDTVGEKGTNLCVFLMGNTHSNLMRQIGVYGWSVPSTSVMAQNFKVGEVLFIYLFIFKASTNASILSSNEVLRRRLAIVQAGTEHTVFVLLIFMPLIMEQTQLVFIPF